MEFHIFFLQPHKGRVNRGEATRARKPCLSKTMSHIIYQRRHRCCRSIPSHQFAAVPCSQHRHILIYPNVLHTNNPSQFANRANHPIALTLPAIQGGPFLLDGSWRQVSHFANDTHTDGYSKVSNDPSADLEGEANAVYVTLFYRSNDRSASAVKTPSKRNAVTRGASPSHPSLYCGEELRNDEGTSRYVVLMTRNRDGIAVWHGWYGVSRREYKALSKSGIVSSHRSIRNFEPFHPFLSISWNSSPPSVKFPRIKTKRSRDVSVNSTRSEGKGGERGLPFNSKQVFERILSSGMKGREGGKFERKRSLKIGTGISTSSFLLPRSSHA